MSALDLDAVEARANAATDGPWEIIGGGEYVTGAELMIGAPDGVAHADARFIAHARTDVPTLLARVRELEAVVARVGHLEPTWHRGMYGSPDDMFSGQAIRAALKGDKS